MVYSTSAFEWKRAEGDGRSGDGGRGKDDVVAEGEWWQVEPVLYTDTRWMLDDRIGVDDGIGMDSCGLHSKEGGKGKEDG